MRTCPVLEAEKRKSGGATGAPRSFPRKQQAQVAAETEEHDEEGLWSSEDDNLMTVQVSRC